LNFFHKILTQAAQVPKLLVGSKNIAPNFNLWVGRNIVTHRRQTDGVYHTPNVK